jgi:glycosyltransferase involved in cell wall biosynthesis
VPVYDSPDLVALLDRIDAAFRGRSERHEVILVDDASPDARVWPQLEMLARQRDHVRAFQLSRNFGQQAATLCGLREARGAVAITMDDDLQHDPADIPLLLAAGDHDIVIGQLAAKQHHVARRAVSRVKNVFDRIVIGTPKGLQLSSFRLLNRTVVDGVLSMRTARPFLPALMFHVSQDAVGVTVTHSRRAGGRSGYTLPRLLGVFSNLVISNSSILLRAGAYAGFTFAFLSFVLAGLVIYHKLAHGIAVQGWTSLFAAVLLIGGLMLIGLGIIGEYLIRIIESGEAKPAYLVRRRSG